jgi:esterase/lipase superfamily enzyme
MLRYLVTLTVSLTLALGASLPEGASAADAVLSVRLFGASDPPFALCPTAQVQPSCNIASTSVTQSDTVGAIVARARRPGISSVVLFLAGYSTNFAHGLAETQHVAEQLGPRFLVVFVDWGSRGAHVDYESDAHSARRNAPAFAALLTALRAALPDRQLGIFAHSMGTRVAVGAIAVVKAAPGELVVNEAVLAAPDLSIDDYRKAITRKPQPFGRITIYASHHDRALFLSAIIHLHRRLGQSLPGRISLADTDVVDASAADRANEGHGYAIHDERVILDIGQTLLGAPTPHAAWKCAEGNLCVLDPSHVPAEIEATPSPTLPTSPAPAFHPTTSPPGP